MRRCPVETFSSIVESVRRGRAIRKRLRSYRKGDNWGNDLWPSGTNFSHRQCHQTVRNHELKTRVASSSPNACPSIHSLASKAQTVLSCAVRGRTAVQAEKVSLPPPPGADGARGLHSACPSSPALTCADAPAMWLCQVLAGSFSFWSSI